MVSEIPKGKGETIKFEDLQLEIAKTFWGDAKQKVDIPHEDVCVTIDEYGVITIADGPCKE